MFTTMIRVAIIYAIVLLFLRLMGKRQIGEMQPFELVITLIIADLATVPMSDSGIPLVNGIIPLAILVIIHYILTLLSQKSIFLRTALSGSPIIVITPNGIDYRNIKELNITIDDLQEALRELGYFNLDEIQYAIVETNGKLSVLPTAQASPTKVQDLKLKTAKTELPYLVISDGQMVQSQLERFGKTKEYIMQVLKSKKVDRIKDVTVLTIDKSNKVYLQTKDKPYISFTYRGEK